jgi:phospholipid/cholesterol/gamma-HCH transport system ATP-binding protein
MSEEKVVEVRDLTTILGGKIIHKGISLSVNKGEIYAIVGGSGSGKTVLLREMVMLIKPFSGSIKVLGYDLSDLSPKEARDLRSRWGVLFQFGGLISSLTVSQNVALPLIEFTDIPRSLIDELVSIKLKLANFPLDFACAYPSEISGGMIKRAALARALALDPEILFLDEPTSGLDPVAAAHFDRTIKELRDLLGPTVVLVTHDINTIESIVDRMVVLLEGEVLVEGTPEEVARFPHPWIQDYFYGRKGEKAWKEK